MIFKFHLDLFLLANRFCNYFPRITIVIADSCTKAEAKRGEKTKTNEEAFMEDMSKNFGGIVIINKIRLLIIISSSFSTTLPNQHQTKGTLFQQPSSTFFCCHTMANSYHLLKLKLMLMFGYTAAPKLIALSLAEITKKKICQLTNHSHRRPNKSVDVH